MNNPEDILGRRVNRRSFLRNGAIAAGTVTAGAALLSHGLPALGQSKTGGSPTKGDIAILRYLAAIELIESDLWAAVPGTRWRSGQRSINPGESADSGLSRSTHWGKRTLYAGSITPRRRRVAVLFTTIPKMN